MTQISDEVLDAVLAVQILVGWAGEGRSEPPRLGWWATDLVDEFGGGDFFRRLMPKTHAWAALEAVREAGRQHSEALRNGSARADQVRSLFHFGYELDRLVDERLRALKESGAHPREVLPGLGLLDEEFSAERFAQALRALSDEAVSASASPSTRQTPGGLLVRAEDTDDTLTLLQTLTRSLAEADLASSFPQPHVVIG